MIDQINEASASSSDFYPESPNMDIDVVSFTPAPDMISNLARQKDSPTPSSSSNGSNEKRYFCQRCLNHRLEFPRKGHKPYCRYANCECDDCIMVEKRRQLNNQLSKRKLDPSAPKPEPGQKKIRDPKCARCSAHGKDQALRGHKRALCPFSDCTCNLCKLVENRRSLMARQIKLRRDQQKARRAQQTLDEAEDEIRRSIDLDLSSPMRSEPQRKRSKPFDLDNLLKIHMNVDENKKPEEKRNEQISAPVAIRPEISFRPDLPIQFMPLPMLDHYNNMNQSPSPPQLLPNFQSPTTSSPLTTQPTTLFNPTLPIKEVPALMNPLTSASSPLGSPLLPPTSSNPLSKLIFENQPIMPPSTVVPSAPVEWFRQNPSVWSKETPEFNATGLPDVVPISTALLQQLFSLAAKNL
uniref:MAB-3 n=1 Tax=Bursaphelenchus xylophilus TaxID=6326 RepID=A0A7T0M7X5_BURXY|nr:MAB-3 [Bursaphelenchus xylophilus]